MKRLTPKREKEIRFDSKNITSHDCEMSEYVPELLAEIDRLRAELNPPVLTAVGALIIEQDKHSIKHWNILLKDRNYLLINILIENDNLQQAVFKLEIETGSLKDRIENLREVLSLYVFGDENGAIDDGGELGQKTLADDDKLSRADSQESDTVRDNSRVTRGGEK